MARAITNLHIAITTAAATAPIPAVSPAPKEPKPAPAGGQYIATSNFANISTLFHKGLTTFGASDLDFPLTSRDSDLLSAGGTLINMMCLTLLHIPLHTGKPAFYLIFILKILIIFQASLISISGQHPEISINQAK